MAFPYVLKFIHSVAFAVSFIVVMAVLCVTWVLSLSCFFVGGILQFSCKWQLGYVSKELRVVAMNENCRVIYGVNVYNAEA